MDWQARTIQTYDDAAPELAEYFGGFGSRIDDVERGLELVGGGVSAKVVEIGCGDGRDTEEITKRVDWYEGVDPSGGLLKIARKRLPQASFVKADALTYDYPKDSDVVFAFASLLHVNHKDLPKVFTKVESSLRTGGIFFVSLKERQQYQEEMQEDSYGERMFYYYNPSIIREIGGSALTPVYEDHQKIGKTDWFTMALKKS